MEFSIKFRGGKKNRLVDGATFLSSRSRFSKRVENTWMIYLYEDIGNETFNLLTKRRMLTVYITYFVQLVYQQLTIHALGFGRTL